jgi:predicted ferric reductase
MKRWLLIIITSGLIAMPIYIWSKTLIHSFPEDATLNIYIGVYVYDLGRFLAIVGFVLIFIQFALSSKIKLIESGIGLDKLISLHRVFGVIGLVFIVIHPAALYSGNILQIYGVQDLGSYFKSMFLANIFLKTVGFVSLIILCVSAGIAILYKYVRMKYETWKNVHMILYGALPIAFIHSARLGSDVIRSVPLKIYWWILLGLFFVISIHRIWMWFSIRRNPFTVTKVVQETYDTWSLFFKGKNNGYKPGQFMIIQLLRKGKLSEPHPFTISSSPTSRELSISVKSVGDFTSTIGETTTADFAYIDKPYGVFSFLNYDEKNLVFISGGIGVTPFISMLRYIRDKKLDRNVILIWGNKTSADLAFKDELKNMDDEMPSLSIIHVMSNQNDWQGEKGYINAEKIRRYVNDFDSSQFFICGPPKMMESVIKTLKEIGVPRQRIHYERFAMR